MSGLLQTVFLDNHKQLDAQLVEFGGWEMPIQYPKGIIKEHLACRTRAGIFDVSHMGRLYFRGILPLSFSSMCSPTTPPPLKWGKASIP